MVSGCGMTTGAVSDFGLLALPAGGFTGCDASGFDCSDFVRVSFAGTGQGCAGAPCANARKTVATNIGKKRPTTAHVRRDYGICAGWFA
jgi:hypothetical protein